MHAHNQPPRTKVSEEKALELFPALRQSLLSSADDCLLSTLLSLKYSQGWSHVEPASGILLHRFFAESLRTMRSTGSVHIPVGEALAILKEVCRQTDVAPEDVVRVPMRERRNMVWIAKKWANENQFNIQRIVDVEKTLEHQITYDREGGGQVTRTLTGTLDVLIADPENDGAIVMDWKTGWGLPPKRDDDAMDPGVSYHGYFQQRFYGWLVMKNFPAVKRVVLREFYVRHRQVRKAVLTRQALEHVEDELAELAFNFDRAVMHGSPDLKKPLKIGKLGYWNPSPGKHCSYCAAAGRCPIEPEARREGAITSQAQAERYAQEFIVSGDVRKKRMDSLKAWVDVHGPVPVKDSKGRRVLGFKRMKSGGLQFGAYTPDTSDRGPVPVDLADALNESADRAKAA